MRLAYMWISEYVTSNS